jgi:hypothetical protein
LFGGGAGRLLCRSVVLLPRLELRKQLCVLLEKLAEFVFQRCAPGSGFGKQGSAGA